MAFELTGRAPEEMEAMLLLAFRMMHAVLSNPALRGTDLAESAGQLFRLFHANDHLRGPSS
jgi:hypothetical protein